jgi:4-hydroxy-2-oxoheptanedioate aldolase
LSSHRAPEIKKRLQNGGIVYSAWLTFGSPAIAEVIAGSGFDVLLIDLEHTSIGLDTLEGVFAAVGRWDPVTIVRVPGLERSLIKRILDIGADGILVPMVMDADEARGVVNAVKYAPLGRRGFGPRRASDYFRNPGYFAAANDRTFVVPQIEHIAAVEHAEAIAAVEGIDAICLGPMDLSVSCGLVGQIDHPTVAGAIDRVFAAAAGRGLPVCMGRMEPPEVQPRWVAKGARFVIASDDLAVLRSGLAHDLEKTRRLLGESGASPASDRLY